MLKSLSKYINSDLEILEACREEFHRRLKAYQAWKSRNAQKRAKDEEVKPDLQITPAPVITGFIYYHLIYYHLIGSQRVV